MGWFDGSKNDITPQQQNNVLTGMLMTTILVASKRRVSASVTGLFTFGYHTCYWGETKPTLVDYYKRSSVKAIDDSRSAVSSTITKTRIEAIKELRYGHDTHNLLNLFGDINFWHHESRKVSAHRLATLQAGLVINYGLYTPPLRDLAKGLKICDKLKEEKEKEKEKEKVEVKVEAEAEEKEVEEKANRP
ncbi:MAG: hypothetical protein P1U34_07270 [Coxiellaceae bacterium]|nr:hypothetical protein [Coxiellaceae bacterium]